MTLLAHIADRALNRPLLITPDKAQVILSVLGGRIGLGGPEASRFEGDAFTRDQDGRPVSSKPYRVSSGVAIITITGSLVNRGAWIGASSGLTSYEGIQHQLKTARLDPDVHAAILDLSSPGGEAIGAMETAAEVRQLAAAKRTVAFVNGMACSAAYAIASGASEIVSIETGVSGSIGVVLLHADFSRNLANEGITPTLIFAGAHKVDGNPFEPLPDTVRDDLQAEVNAFYDAFLKTVAAGRGNRLTAAGARKTEARSLIAGDAVAAGLVDRVGTFQGVLSELSKRAPGGGATTGPTRSKRMDNFTQADVDAARAEGRTEGERLGAQGATDRIAAIVTAEGIKGSAQRMSAALSLATEAPGMSAEKVIAHVVGHVVEGGSQASPAALSRRAEVPDSLASAGIGASAEKPKAKIDTASVYASRRQN